MCDVLGVIGMIGESRIDNQMSIGPPGTGAGYKYLPLKSGISVGIAVLTTAWDGGGI
jgi:hypothetical protein